MIIAWIIAGAIVTGLVSVETVGAQLPTADPRADATARALALDTPFVDEMPKIDGHLTEDAWERAAVAGSFVQKEPRAGQLATEPTEVRVFYTRTALVIGARLGDTHPDRIVASEYRRDGGLGANDRFEVFLDTFHDRRNAFYFATNPVGVQRDGLIRSEGEALNWEWDGIWDVAASRDAHGWTVEMAIPFSTLRFHANQDTAWGVNFGRLVARTREESYWAPISKDWGFNAKWRVSAFGTLVGVRPVRSASRLPLKPYVLAGAEAGPLVGPATEAVRKAGLDAKFSLGSNLVTDLTVNTDFAQVESDQQRVNLTRFPLFYPEKREFFLENAGLFQVGERVRSFEPPTTLLFFSRRIGLTDDGRVVPLLGGARVTGKLGPYDIGALDIVSAEHDFPNDQQVPRSNFGALRVKRDLWQRSSIGAIALSRYAGPGRSNTVIAADATIAPRSDLSVVGFVAKSETSGVGGSTYALGVDADWATDRVGMFGSYVDLGDGFRSEMGFIERTGARKYRVAPYVARRPNVLGVRQIFFGTDHLYITDRDGALQSLVSLPGIVVAFNDGAQLTTLWTNQHEALTAPFQIRQGVIIPTGTYRFDMGTISVDSAASRPIAGRGSYTGGTFYDGTRHTIVLGAAVRPHGRLTIDVDYQRNAIDLPVANGRFTTNLAIARSVFAFSPRMFVRGLVQWNQDVDLRTNLLFRYAYRPGADIFIVYNHDKGLRTDPPIQTGRSVLVKATVYLARF